MNFPRCAKEAKTAAGCVDSERFKKMTDYCGSSTMAAMHRTADMSIGALTAKHCCIPASTSSIPKTATVRDGSSGKPAGDAAIAGAFLRKATFTAVCLITGGHCIRKVPALMLDMAQSGRYNEYIKGRCDKRLALQGLTFSIAKSRHLAEWRFLLFTVIVIVYVNT